MNTFQAVISTDGERSFAALLYADPIVDVDLFIGFTSAQEEFADVRNTSLQRDSFWDSTHIYRIDGKDCLSKGTGSRGGGGGGGGRS